jgi:DNA-binding response OmpR family regulator
MFMVSNHILIVEDDSDINNLLAEILKRNGYNVSQAYSGTEAKLLLQTTVFALIMLDLMLPGMTGEDLIPVIRQTGAVPIIVLSARETPQDKAHVLRIGADDYMTKPFDEDELLARIEACLRRAGQTPESPAETLVFRDITLDRELHLVTVSGNPIQLTAREFAILELFMGNPKKVFTKANLYRSIWNDEFYGDDNTVNVHISKIRTKLGGDYIQTVWGIGFKLQEE